MKQSFTVGRLLLYMDVEVLVCCVFGFLKNEYEII